LTIVQRSVLLAVLVGGLAGGALDILFAISFAAYNGMPPVRLLQVVASGVLGTNAYAGGVPVAILGLGLHFAMSFAWAALFLLASRRMSILTRHPLLWGGLFGVIVFFVMRLVVLPFSAFPHPVTFKPLAASLDLLSHILLFGIPIALAVRRFAPTGVVGK
jgi:uncharacterized membrane protein YagU involved in acid resistance